MFYPSVDLFSLDFPPFITSRPRALAAIQVTRMSEKEASEADIFAEKSTTQSLDDSEVGSQERLLAERRLVRKLDMWLIPTVFIIFIMNYTDRNGVTAARLKGLQQDLHINDVQYATVIAILFVTFCPSQIPSNMILNKVSRPSLYLGISTVLWGMTRVLSGITKDYAGILASRVFIGLPESAFHPGAIYLLSRWYTKKELAFRCAILYAGLLISNAFGSFIAAGILTTMDGKRGIRAWRWLFFIEGAMTIFLGLNSMWMLPDYPHNTRWMNAAERRLAQARLAEDAGEADKDSINDSPFRGLMMAIKDPLVPIFAIMTMSQLLGLSFISYFLSLTQTLGFNTTFTLLLAAPPWILASIICCLNALHADKTGERFFHIVGWWWAVIVGFSIALSNFSIATRYVSLFMMACGYVGAAMMLVWVSNAVPRPPAKRAAAIGIVSGCGNLGNVVGSYAWNAAWGPEYHQSMAISLAALVFSSLLALVIRQILVRKNKNLDEDEKLAMEGTNQMRVEEAARLEGITFEIAMENKKGYRYLY